jgi:hypothetical protein
MHYKISPVKARVKALTEITWAAMSSLRLCIDMGLAFILPN